MSGKAATGATTDANNIKVVARFRPLNPLERSQRDDCECVELHDAKVELKINEEQQPYSFEYDRVYPKDAKQSEIFDFTGRQIVQDVFKGYNGTIFAYGQTGSGKTFTMMGPNASGLQGYCDDPELKGIIPRVVELMFQNVEEADEHIEFTIKVSYVEIYMERIRDLLEPKKVNLPLHEDFKSGRGVYVGDATEVYVSDSDEVFRLMQAGASNRAVASTRMNDESSRSHSIFQITVTQKHSVRLDQKSGKLFLVDLAGSEKVGKTGAAGQQLDEAKLINKSLSTLGHVINSLTDKRSTHVPYRDSKLTRLLQDSLGGNSRTTLLICCSPSRFNDQETLSTLRFGERAKTIKNKAKINREWTVAELKILLDKAEREISGLKKSKGIEDSAEAQAAQQQLLLDMENEWEAERSRMADERDDLLQQLLELREEHVKVQQELTQESMDKSKLQQEADMWGKEYQELTDKYEDVKLCWEKEKETVAEQSLLIDNHLKINEELQTTAQTLKSQAATLKAELAELHSKAASAEAVPTPEEKAENAPEPASAEPQDSAVQQELDRLKKENEFLKSTLIRNGQQVPEGQPDGTPSSPGDANRWRDIQSKCERVIDLEMGLDEARESYKQLMQNSNSKYLRRKINVLEQQAEQQSETYQEVYNENSTLRLEIQLAEKKLAIRNERIENLKAGLKEEKKHLKELQEQFANERDKFKGELGRYKEENNYWKEKALTRERGAAGRKSTKNVVKVLKGGSKPTEAKKESEKEDLAPTVLASSVMATESQ